MNHSCNRKRILQRTFGNTRLLAKMKSLFILSVFSLTCVYFVNLSNGRSIKSKKATSQSGTKREDQGEMKHHDYAEMTKFLQEWQQKCSKISSLSSVGKSVEGRELWVYEISSNPGKHEPGEPEVKYIANMHGNEVVGREMILQMIKTFCTEQEHDQRLKFLVDNTRILLMPSMNPDGYELAVKEGKGDWLVGRSNANDVDLNRNFPDQFTNSPNAQLQPEAMAVEEWIKKSNVVLAANLHGGSLVANYPYDDSPTGDSSYSKSPDDDVFRFLASTYARAHPTMHLDDAPWECTEIPADHFKGGITNGANWYNVAGGMQDYDYLHSNCMEITLELGCKKFPDAKDLPRYWSENKEPLLKFIEQVHRGVKGFVFDQNGAPIGKSKIMVNDRAHPVHAGSDGDYWRILLPGDYEIRAYKKGYEPMSHKVKVVDGPPTVLNFTLKRSEVEEASGRGILQQVDLLSQKPASNPSETNNQALLQPKLQSLLQGSSEPSLPLLTQFNPDENVNQLASTAPSEEDWSPAVQVPSAFNSISEPSDYGVSDADARQLEHRLTPEKNLLDHFAMDSPFEQMTGNRKTTTFYDDSEQMFDDMNADRNNFFEKKFDYDSDEAH